MGSFGPMRLNPPSFLGAARASSFAMCVCVCLMMNAACFVTLFRFSICCTLFSACAGGVVANC